MTVVHLDETEPGCDSFKELANLDQAAMDALPQAVYLCAGDGRVIRFNQKAVDLWGRVPKAGSPEERFCGSFRMYRADGTILPHSQCPMATALKTGESFENQEVVVEQPGGRQRTVLVNIAAFRDGDGRVNGAVNCFHDISERKEAEERQRQMIGELNHRIKNMFAIVQSMAVNTARNSTSVEQFASRFEARLLALSNAQALFSEDQEKPASLDDLLAHQLRAFVGGDDRVRYDGPQVQLPPRWAMPLSMVFHELITNAAKYGALSVGDGRIAIEWTLLPGAEDVPTLSLKWEEMNGPTVSEPDQKGFGSRLIERLIVGGLGGQARLLFEPSGLRFFGSLPLRD